MRIAFIFLLCLQLPARIWAMGSSPRNPTILLVPAVHSVVQLGRDFVERENVLLMTYAPKTAPQSPHLHAWSGTDWVRVTPEAFAAGSFLRVPAARLIVVGPADPLTASLIESGSSWSPEVLNLESSNITDLVNSLGRLYNFRQSDWKWFANRYELKLEDLNAESRGQSWYDTNRASELPPPQSPIRRGENNRGNDATVPAPHPVLMPEAVAPTETPNPLPPPPPAASPVPAEPFSFDPA